MSFIPLLSYQLVIHHDLFVSDTSNFHQGRLVAAPRAVHRPIEPAQGLEPRTTGKGNIRMTDQNPQVSPGVETRAGEQNGQGSKVHEAWQLATGAVTAPAAAPVKQPFVEVAPATISNRTMTYGVIAATIGIAAGLAIASLSGHAAPRGGASTSGTANSNATSLATLVKAQPPVSADAIIPALEPATAQTTPDLQPKPASHRKAKKKELDVPARFAIEGDDELVGYDTSKGVIQTSARKTFLVTVTSVGGTSSAWQEWPANIHYKCDLNSSCTLTRRGGAVLYAQLKK